MSKKIEAKTQISISSIIAIILLLVVVSGAGYLIDRYNPKEPTNNVAAVQSIRYEGIDGKNALDLLKENNQVATQDTSLGVFVQEINGMPNSETNYWIYYVNGQMGTVWPDQYQTKNGDTIEWRYENAF